MKYILGFALVILTSVGAFAQTIRVKFNVTPSSNVTVTIDGEVYTKPMNDYIVMGFNAKKGITEHRVVFSSPGYEKVEMSFNIDDKRTQVHNIQLPRKVDKISPKENFVLSFEKVISGIEYNTPIGDGYRWKYNDKEVINIDDKEELVIDYIEKLGLKSTREDQEVESLFGEVSEPEEKKPDVLVAGKVVACSLSEEKSDGFFSYSSGRSFNVDINWQFYDTHSKTVLHKETQKNVYSFEGESVTSNFYNAIAENFYTLISGSDELKEVLNNYEIKKKSFDIDAGTEGDETQALTKTKIPRTNYENLEEFSDLVKYAINSSVTIIVDDKGHGSGFVASKNGYIITNQHVVEDVSSVEVQFSTGLILNGDVVAKSEKYDLALVKVNAGGLTPLQIATGSSTVNQGDDVFVVGTPGDQILGQSITKGVVSGKRLIEEVKYIQTDTKISPGSSGSPLINEKGEVIGVINMKLVGEGIEGLSFAIDSKYIFSVLGVEYE